jgi:hypothetical protein
VLRVALFALTGRDTHVSVPRNPACGVSLFAHSARFSHQKASISTHGISSCSLWYRRAVPTGGQHWIFMHSSDKRHAVPFLRRLAASHTLRRPQVRSQVSPCGIFGGQSDSGTGFSPSTSVFRRRYHSTIGTHSGISLNTTLFRRTSGRSLGKLQQTNAISNVGEQRAEKYCDFVYVRFQSKKRSVLIKTETLLVPYVVFSTCSQRQAVGTAVVQKPTLRHFRRRTQAAPPSPIPRWGSPGCKSRCANRHS